MKMFKVLKEMLKSEEKMIPYFRFITTTTLNKMKQYILKNIIFYVSE